VDQGSQTISRVLREGFGLIGRFVRARPVSFGLAVAGAIVFAAAIVASAVVIGRITDELIIPTLDGGVPVGTRWFGAALAVVAVAVWKAAGITVRRTAAGWLQFRTAADVRYRLIEHQMGLELSWFARQSTGDLLAVSETDARQGTFILAPLPFGTGATLLLFGSVAIISYLDWLLGVLTLGALGAIVVIDVIGAWRMFAVFQAVQLSRGVVSGVAHESFDGALTIKALGREDFETDRLRNASNVLRDDLVLVGRVWGSYRAVVESLPSVTTVLLLVVGALRLGIGGLTPGDLVTIAYLLALLTIPIQLIGFVLWDLAHSLAGWHRVERVMEATERVSYGGITARPTGTGASVTGSEVGFAYSAAEPVLAGIDLDISAGRSVAIVGATGSGKSTLAMLLARLWDPTNGSIRLDGRDVREFARSALPGEVSFVPQEAFLFDDDVRGNITLGIPAEDAAVINAAALAAADEFIRELPDGYATRIGERGTTLSGGQKQRIALARALIRRPRLLILDDATSAVDPSVETAILRGLQQAELPSTVVVVAHRPSSIRLADEVVFLEEGSVVAHGSHDRLLAEQPGYVRLLTAYEEDAALRRAEGTGAVS
jgi:ABC-type multidrug transport system fused ATPase/permease subunit